MKGIELWEEALPQVGPVGLQLLVEQPLGPREVLDPDKTIALPAVLESSLIHLTGQPFPAVDGDLNMEGKPGLDTGMHPSQQGMDLVMIEHMGWLDAADDVMAQVFECGARFQSADGAHQSVLNGSFAGLVARQLVFVHFGSRTKMTGRFCS